MIRAAQDRDIPTLRTIERRAGAAFATVGMAAIAEDEPPSADTLRGYLHAGRAWVHADENDRPVAYVLVDMVDGAAHIEQVSVDPDHAGRRLGTGLMEHVATWASDRGATALTLTAFTEVPWNGPLYERRGFRRLADDELTPGLRRVRADEAAHGLDRWPRACYRRALPPTPNTAGPGAASADQRHAG